MNINIQNLIKSFSPEKRQEIQQYVVKNMDDAIREATMHNSVTPEMQNQLDKLIIQYLEINYPDDINHTMNVSKKEVEDKIFNMVNKKLDLLSVEPIHNDIQTVRDDTIPILAVESEVKPTVVEPKALNLNLGPQVQSVKSIKEVNPQPSIPVVSQKEQNAVVHTPVNKVEPIVVDEQGEEDQYEDQNSLLSSNTTYDQVHDKENRFFGLQSSIYKFIAHSDDETAESYFKIALVVAAIAFVLGAWNLFNAIDAIGTMKYFFQTKSAMYMRHLAEFCQPSLSDIKVFQQCVADRQVSLIWTRRIDAFKDFLIAVVGFIGLFITYFLKINYRGRDAYLVSTDDQ